MRDCVSVCVYWCPFCVRCAARSLNTLGSPSAPSLKESSFSCPPHTTDSPLPLSCALRVRIPSLCSLPARYNFTETGDRMCQSRPPGLPCGALSLCSSNWAIHTRLPRTPRLLVADHCALTLILSAGNILWGLRARRDSSHTIRPHLLHQEI